MEIDVFRLWSGRMIVMRTVFKDEMEYIRVVPLDAAFNRKDRNLEQEIRFSEKEEKESLSFAQLLDQELKILY